MKCLDEMLMSVSGTERAIQRLQQNLRPLPDLNSGSKFGEWLACLNAEMDFQCHVP